MNLAQQLNHRAAKLCQMAEIEKETLGIESSQVNQVTRLDFGAQGLGQLNAGLLLAKICMADLARVQLGHNSELKLPEVQVETDQPLSACIASQYAGWPFSTENYFAMASGPARMSRGEEELLDEHGLHLPSDLVVGVLETSSLPGPAECDAFLGECRASKGYLCVARTASHPGTLQVVARSVETAMHKLHEVGFDLRNVKTGFGVAPLPPIAKDDLTALGWTNDAILYGGRVNLWVEMEDEELAEIGSRVPSGASDSFGRPFLELFKEAGHDFYKMDKLLFSPAQITFNNVRTGSVHTFGEPRWDVLENSFGLNRP